MKLTDLTYDYPENLVAMSPERPSRILYHQSGKNREINKNELLEKFTASDILVVNDTKVEPRRVFTNDGVEIVFIEQRQSNEWVVLFPNRGKKVGSHFELPGGICMTLVEKGIPQLVNVEPEFPPNWFEQYGELPIPPYIQKARGARNNSANESEWYQVKWAEKKGSLAAPTASLHFDQQDLEHLQQRGVKVVKVTLHVGLGTFLPIKVENLSDHKMHEEKYSVTPMVAECLRSAKSRGQKVWVLGTTCARVLETLALTEFRQLQGRTDIFIYPPYQFQLVDGLLTNFHQPHSTLLALVCAFAGESNVLDSYRWAVKNNFRLFSYGDLSVWC